MDFQFLQNPVFHKWVISAPRRSRRPDVANGMEPVCPFCSGREGEETELYRVKSSEHHENDSGWLVRVVPNKFPFAPIHEVVIHSPDHHKNFGELHGSHVELILQTYRSRYKLHQNSGQVYIFHNRGERGGESLPHPHSQIAVVPNNVKMEIPRLESARFPVSGTNVETIHFELFCPAASQWPDEVWVAPKKSGRLFGEITDEEIEDLARVLNRLVQIFDLRHGHEFPFNFYIYPGGDWYLRVIPRVKTLGGFEVGTGIFVNTQKPEETMQFLQEHFHKPDQEKIKTEHRAEYEKRV